MNDDARIVLTQCSQEDYDVLIAGLFAAAGHASRNAFDQGLTAPARAAEAAWATKVSGVAGRLCRVHPEPRLYDIPPGRSLCGETTTPTSGPREGQTLTCDRLKGHGGDCRDSGRFTSWGETAEAETTHDSRLTTLLAAQKEHPNSDALNELVGRRWADMTDEERRAFWERDPTLARTRMNPGEWDAFTERKDV